jgi:TonB family protein
LASKVGQRQLLTNPSSRAVRVPAVLQRSGQTFSASVNICVSATGQVSKVSILRSASPALDPQIAKMLSGWRYRPLLEAGKPTPFCYPLNYEIDPR